MSSTEHDYLPRHPKLRPFVDTLRAESHRGFYYFARYSREENWTVYFHEWSGGCEQLVMSADYDNALARAQAHAYMQPELPPMLGWPAQAGVLS